MIAAGFALLIATLGLLLFDYRSCQIANILNRLAPEPEERWKSCVLAKREFQFYREPDLYCPKCGAPYAKRGDWYDHP